MHITADDFQRMTGYPPRQDDLERCNCKKDSVPGHYYCGVCTKHDKPRFVCGCSTFKKDAS